MSEEARPKPMSAAEIIAVGSELLTPFRTDTNSLFLTTRLNELGIEVRAKAIVGDRRDDLSVIFRQAVERVDLVVVTGGLGPTEDDVTREVVASVFDLPLEEDVATLARINERFARRGLVMPSINRRQAMVPRGAILLDNPNGTAPGLWIERKDRMVVLLPGPPRELQPMFEAHVLPRLAVRSGGARLFRRVLRITGRPESYVDEVTQPVYSTWQAEVPPIDTTILAALGQIELHLTLAAANADDAGRRLGAAVQALLKVLGRDVFSVDGRTLEQVVGGLLREASLRIAVAESCTGGLVSSRLTDVPGSSEYVERGIVAYSNEAKTELLDVPADLIRAHGAVSEPVARAMAEGIRRRAQVDIGVGVTGIAGPGGGTPEKPVGTVVVAVCTPADTRVRTLRLTGARDQVKYQASQAALDMVRRMLDAAP